MGRRRFLGSVRAPYRRLFTDILVFPTLKKSVAKSLKSLFSQSRHSAVCCTGLYAGNPSLDLGARRKAPSSPGRRTRVRPMASRQVSGREAGNSGYEGELTPFPAAKLEM
jgi:hypothetical protein